MFVADVSLTAQRPAVSASLSSCNWWNRLSAAASSLSLLCGSINHNNNMYFPAGQCRQLQAHCTFPPVRHNSDLTVL